MRMSYEVFVRHEVYRSLRDLQPSDTGRVLSFVESLADNPFDPGHYTERDSTGRECRVKMVGQFAIFFWVDNSEKEVRIVDLIDAGTT